MKPARTKEELVPASFTVNVPNYIVRDFQAMEKHTKKTVDDMVTTALKMYLATHNDYLGRVKVGGG